jgi:hypothetical protein
MKWKFVFGLFSFLCCIACLNSSRMRVQTQTACTAYDAREIAMPVSGYNLESSTRFAGYNRGTSSSLLVVETWETSPFNNSPSYYYSPERLTRGDRKLKMNDYSKMLLNAEGSEKMKMYNSSEESSKFPSIEATHYSKRKSGVALFR